MMRTALHRVWGPFMWMDPPIPYWIDRYEHNGIDYVRLSTRLWVRRR